MRAASTAVSLTTHVGLVAVALWATATAHPRLPSPPLVIIDVPFPSSSPSRGAVPTTPGMPVIGGDVRIPLIDPPTIDGGVDLDLARPVFGVLSPGPVFAEPASGDGGPLDASLVDQLPMMLAGPVPPYPDLLRQAGIHGRVVLEAVVDTAGHLEPGSVVVVASAHPAFVAPAQQALLASLFRPARMRGVPVRVRVRIAIDFVLRDGRL